MTIKLALSLILLFVLMCYCVWYRLKRLKEENNEQYYIDEEDDEQ